MATAPSPIAAAMPMRIARISVRPMGRGLIVTVEAGTGQRGMGEACPLPGYSKETLDQCAAALAEINPATLSLSEGDDVLAKVAARVDRLQQVPAAAFALETALLDVYGRMVAKPIHRLLAPGPAPGIELNALVDSDDTAEDAVSSRFRCLKLKLGRGDLDRELALAARLRARYGDQVSLRFDANRSLEPRDVEPTLAALAALSPEYVEEPVPDTLGLTGAPVPLALDETVAEHVLDFAACARAGVRAVVLKPMKLGGAIRCMDLARRARAAGIEPVVTHMMDGPIALAAATELALAMAPTLACGLAAHPGLDDWPASWPRQIHGARAAGVVAAGHGLVLR